MRPTEDLVREHGDILAMIQVVREMVRRLDAGTAVDPGHIEKAIYFIRHYADKYHHAKEEDLLFPAMHDAGVPREGGPIAVMLAEHDEGRAYVRNAAEALERYRAGDGAAAQVVAANLRNYGGLLEQHISKENQVLYPIADAHIGQTGQTELRWSFDHVNAKPEMVEECARCKAILMELDPIYLDED
ncbi:MAG TPA: hemerythrin domain-containing protein [Thermoleophilia bacterium]|nr:hemerythrin domain-containing protein [Thermoleophilia bacterium]